jgi:hypothetical protein
MKLAFECNLFEKIKSIKYHVCQSKAAPKTLHSGSLNNPVFKQKSTITKSVQRGFVLFYLSR